MIIIFIFHWWDRWIAAAVLHFHPAKQEEVDAGMEETLPDAQDQKLKGGCVPEDKQLRNSRVVANKDQKTQHCYMWRWCAVEFVLFCLTHWVYLAVGMVCCSSYTISWLFHVHLVWKIQTKDNNLIIKIIKNWDI